MTLPPADPTAPTLADLGSRAGAYIFDVLICFVAWFFLSVLWWIRIPFEDWSARAALPIVALWPLIHVASFALQESLLSGQTYGKRLIGIRVVQKSGAPITFVQAWTRNLLRLIDDLPFSFVVGTIAVCASRRRIGDFVAGTIVVVEPTVHAAASATPPLRSLPVDATDAERAFHRAWHHRVARLQPAAKQPLAARWAAHLHRRWPDLYPGPDGAPGTRQAPPHGPTRP